jgi:hypothetical protein
MGLSKKRLTIPVQGRARRTGSVMARASRRIGRRSSRRPCPASHGEGQLPDLHSADSPLAVAIVPQRACLSRSCRRSELEPHKERYRTPRTQTFSRNTIKRPISASGQASETHPFFGTLFCASNSHRFCRIGLQVAKASEMPRRPMLQNSNVLRSAEATAHWESGQCTARRLDGRPHWSRNPGVFFARSVFGRRIEK